MIIACINAPVSDPLCLMGAIEVFITRTTQEALTYASAWVCNWMLPVTEDWGDYHSKRVQKAWMSRENWEVIFKKVKLVKFKLIHTIRESLLSKLSPAIRLASSVFTGGVVGYLVM